LAPQRRPGGLRKFENEIQLARTLEITREGVYK